MASVKDGLELVETFISVGKELAKLPALVLPQYKEAAEDLYEICQKLLAANEATARWLHRFRYFDFKEAKTRSTFLAVVRKYRSLKAGPSFKKLKFSCGDISQVYRRHIEAKLMGWFSSAQKREEAEGIFQKLTDADEDMVNFLQTHVLGRIDAFLALAEPAVEAGDVPRAEELRLKLKAETTAVALAVERFGDDLSELVLAFARLARVPLTL